MDDVKKKRQTNLGKLHQRGYDEQRSAGGRLEICGVRKPQTVERRTKGEEAESYGV